MNARQREEIRWTIKRISTDYRARAGVSTGATDEKQREFMRREFQMATLHERINRRGGINAK